MENQGEFNRLYNRPIFTKEDVIIMKVCPKLFVLVTLLGGSFDVPPNFPRNHVHTDLLLLDACYHQHHWVPHQVQALDLKIKILIRFSTIACQVICTMSY